MRSQIMTATDTYLLLRAFCDEFARCGMEHACTAPGSRCTTVFSRPTRNWDNRGHGVATAETGGRVVAVLRLGEAPAFSRSDQGARAVDPPGAVPQCPRRLRP